MPAGLIDLLRRKDKSVESHTTLQVSVNTTSVVREYFFASAGITFNGINWQPMLRKGSQIRSTLTRSADIATVTLANGDTALGVEFLALGQSLYNAGAKIGRLWRDTMGGAEFHKILLTGIVVGLQIDENFVQLTAV